MVEKVREFKKHVVANSEDVGDKFVEEARKIHFGESEKRGIYGGAVGYISCEGDLDTAIVLRTAIIKDGVMHVRAGAGVVLDSDPQLEYEETQHKAQALFSAASAAAQFDRN